MGKVWIWSTPRSSSTVMEHALRQGSSTWGYHEPCLDAYYLGPGRKSAIFDEHQDWLKDNKDSTYETTFNMIDKTVETSSCTNFVIKDMSYYYTHFGVEEPWALPSSFEDFFVVLLVRHPVLVAESYLRGNYGEPFEENELGFRGHANVYGFLKSSGRPFAVVDADKFLQSPGTILAKICAMSGLSYEETMLKWPAKTPRPDWRRAIKAFPGFYGSVVNSDGFYPKKSIADPAVMYKKLPDWLRAFVDRAMPVYETIMTENHAL